LRKAKLTLPDLRSQRDVLLRGASGLLRRHLDELFFGVVALLVATGPRIPRKSNFVVVTCALAFLIKGGEEQLPQRFFLWVKFSSLSAPEPYFQAPLWLNWKSPPPKIPIFDGGKFKVNRPATTSTPTCNPSTTTIQQWLRKQRRPLRMALIPSLINDSLVLCGITELLQTVVVPFTG
jgi:hypothetical protein